MLSKGLPYRQNKFYLTSYIVTSIHYVRQNVPKSKFLLHPDINETLPSLTLASVFCNYIKNERKLYKKFEYFKFYYNCE